MKHSLKLGFGSKHITFSNILAVDTAIKGFGGCPMAKDDLTGNMPTEKLITYFTEDLKLNIDEFEKSFELSNSIFS